MRAWWLVVLLAAPLRAAEVKGKVTTPDGALPGCVVVLEAGQDRHVAAADANGGYSFAPVPEGPAQLRFEMAGYEPQTRYIAIVAGENLVAAAELRLLSAGTWSERHRVGAALLGRIDDQGIWGELAGLAEDAILFAAGEEAGPWDDLDDGDPAEYQGVAQAALMHIAHDPRSKPLLYRALETSDETLIQIAIWGFAEQKEEGALPAIDATLARTDQWRAIALARFATEAADRVAEKYLVDHQTRAEYARMRREQP